MRYRFFFILLPIATYANAQLPKIENNQLVLDNSVTFKPGTSELAEEGKEALKPVKEFLVAKTYVTLLRVEGHSDNAAMQKLSEQRAMTVCRWLIANGIDCKRLVAVGFGNSKPIEDNSTPEGKSKNRRMVFAMAALRGNMIGGMPADGGGVVAEDVCKGE